MPLLFPIENYSCFNYIEMPSLVILTLRFDVFPYLHDVFVHLVEELVGAEESRPLVRASKMVQHGVNGQVFVLDYFRRSEPIVFLEQNSIA